jgi:hypothetical protein
MRRPTPGRCTSTPRKVASGLAARRVHELLAVAESDLQHERRGAAERAREVARAPCVVQAVARPVPVEGARLRLGDTPLAQHETLDRAMDDLGFRHARLCTNPQLSRRGGACVTVR